MILKDSYIGVIVTGRELRNSYNRVIGFDAKIRFLKNYFLALQTIGSWTKEPNDTTLTANYSDFIFYRDYTSAFDGESFSGMAYRLRFSRWARHWQFNTWYKDCSPTFRADDGFISSNNYRNVGCWTGYEIRPNKWMVEMFKP